MGLFYEHIKWLFVGSCEDKSFFQSLSSRASTQFPAKEIWALKVPSKMCFFVCGKWEKILRID